MYVCIHIHILKYQLSLFGLSRPPVICACVCVHIIYMHILCMYVCMYVYIDTYIHT